MPAVMLWGIGSASELERMPGSHVTRIVID